MLPYAPFALLGAICLLLGYTLGARRAKVVKRRALRDLNAQSLELLDTKFSLNSLEHYASQQGRKDRLLKLAMKKLQHAEARRRQMTDAMSQQDRKYYVDTSRLRLDVVESREFAIKATEIARRATAHLQRLELAYPVTQTIVAPELKSYGTRDPVTVSMVEQARQDTTSNNDMPVSNRDSARFTTLQSSNEIYTPPA